MNEWDVVSQEPAPQAAPTQPADVDPWAVVQQSPAPEEVQRPTGLSAAMSGLQRGARRTMRGFSLAPDTLILAGESAERRSWGDIGSSIMESLRPGTEPTIRGDVVDAMLKGAAGITRTIGRGDALDQRRDEARQAQIQGAVDTAIDMARYPSSEIAERIQHLDSGSVAGDIMQAGEILAPDWRESLGRIAFGATRGLPGIVSAMSGEADTFSGIPSYIAELSAESLPGSIPGIAASMAGGALGGPGGAAAAGGATFGLSSMLQQYGGGIIDYLSGRGYNISNPDTVAELLSDPEILDAALEYAVVSATTQAPYEAVAGAIGPAMLVPRRALANNLAREIANSVAAQPLAQGTVGAMGEKAAAEATGEDFNIVSSLIANVLGEAGMSATETVGARGAARSRAQAEASEDAARAQPAPSDAMGSAQPEAPAAGAGDGSGVQSEQAPSAAMAEPDLTPRAPATPTIEEGVTREQLVEEWRNAGTPDERAAAAARIAAYDAQRDDAGAADAGPVDADGAAGAQAEAAGLPAQDRRAAEEASLSPELIESPEPAAGATGYVPDGTPPPPDGRADKAYLKQNIDTLPDPTPEQLPDDPAAYFDMRTADDLVPTSALIPSKQERASATALRRMAASADGFIPRRDAIDVRENEDGTYTIVDGNGSHAAAQAMGLSQMPVRVVESPPGREGWRRPRGYLQGEASEALTRLYEASAAAKPEFDQIIESIASEFSAQPVTAPLKGRTRAEQKTRDENGGDVNRLNDVLRGSIVLSNPNDAATMIDRLRQSGTVIKEKNAFDMSRPSPYWGGYRDAKVIFQMPNGARAEVILMTAEMEAAKERAHADYKIARDADAAIERGENVEENARAKAEAIARMEPIYAPAAEALRRAANSSSVTRQSPSGVNERARSESVGMRASGSYTTSTGAPPGPGTNAMGTSLSGGPPNSSAPGGGSAGMGVTPSENVRDGSATSGSPSSVSHTTTSVQDSGASEQVQSAVRAVLPGSARVSVVRSVADIPQDVRDRVRLTEADTDVEGFYDPDTRTAYIIEDALVPREGQPVEARAAWVAAHEWVGHYGLRELSGDQLGTVLRRARNNDTVAAVVRAMERQRPERGPALVEEALVELAAAVRTNDYAEISDRYGVEFTADSRGNLRRLIDRLLNALRRALGWDGFTDAELYDLIADSAAAAAGGPETVLVGDIAPRSRVGTRNPTAVKATESGVDPATTVGYESFRADPKAFERNTQLLLEYPGIRRPRGRVTPDRIAESFIEHSVANLLELHDRMPAQDRAVAKDWYVGANREAERLASEYGITDVQAAASIAALSPQKDWFQNLSLAERVIDASVNHADRAWDPGMSETLGNIFGGEKYGALRAAVEGRRLSDLSDPVERAAWIRTYDQTHNDSAFPITSPRGDLVGTQTTASGAPARIQWGSLAEVAKAVSVLEDGSLENVSALLGRQHKIRSFYNNIIEPTNDSDVTIDTHAVAAALLRPLSAATTEVGHNFGAGTSNSSVTGNSGMYGLYAEAYRRAAAERGILPREMQSITWEAVRALYLPPSRRPNSRVVRDTEAAWNEYKQRRIEHGEAVERAVDAGGGIRRPDWAGSAARLDEGEWRRAFRPAVSGSGVPGRGSGPVASRGRGSSGADRGVHPDAAVTLNIGLSTAELRGGGELSRARVMRVLRRTGANVLADSRHVSDSEPTLVVDLDRPLTAEEGNEVSAALDQQAIVQRSVDGSGELFGPMAEAWGPYNPKLFVMPDGDRADRGPVASRARNPQVDTPEFKRWFGDSKIVDENGDPMVVYHGTDAEFDSFRQGPESANGFWFSEQRAIADRYAKMRGGRTHSFYLAVKNPLRVDLDMNDEIMVSRFYETIGVDMPENSRADAVLPVWELLTGANATRQIMKAGYDGIRVREGGEPTVAAFRPEQIKSATGNRGTFDPSDPSIIASRGRRTATGRRGRTARAFSGKPRQPDAVSADAYHYSNTPGLTELDPTFAGTAGAGRERRAFGMGRFGERGGTYARLNFYVREPGAPVPGAEDVVRGAGGSNLYRVQLDNLYDLDNDPRGIVADAGPNVTLMEEEIAAAGFDGFLAGPQPGIDTPVAVVFDLPGTVPVENVDGSQPLPQQQAEPEWGDPNDWLAQYEARRRGPVASRRRTADDARRERGKLFGRLAADGYRMGSPTQTSNQTGGRFATVKQARDAALIALHDKMLPLLRAQQQVAEDGRGISSITLDDAMNAYRAENLMHGAVNDELTGLHYRHIRPIQEAIRKSPFSVDMFEDYLYAKAAPERNREIAKINKAMPDAGSGITTQMAKDIMAGKADGVFSGKRLTPEAIALFDDLNKHVRALRDAALNNMIDAGQITPELAASLRKKYPNYVPMRGKDAELDEGRGGRPGTGRGLSQRAANIRRALGRGADNVPTNILGELVGDAQRSVVAKGKAKVARAMLRFALANPNPDLYTVEPVDLEWRFSEATGEAYLGVKRRGEDVDTSMVIMHKGNPVYLRFNDPQLAAAMLNAGVEDMGKMMRVFSALNRWRSATLTRYNPAFTPVNMARDFHFGTVAIAAEHGPRIAAQAVMNYPSAMRASYRHAAGRRGDASKPDSEKTMQDWAAEAYATGMSTGITHTPNVVDLQRNLQAATMGVMELAASGRPLAAAGQALYRTGRPIIDAIENANEASENAIRLGVYVALRKDGMSKTRAAEYAKNVTINFNRKGKAGPILNAIFLFYNAAMQGGHAVLRVMRDPKVMTYLIGLSVMQGLLSAGLMDDDDGDGITEWDKIPDYVKRTSLIFPLSEGKYFAMPMPYGFNWFTYLGGRGTQRMILGDRPTDSSIMVDLAKSLSEAFSPIPFEDGYRSLFGDQVGLAMGLAANRDDFGSPIAQLNPYEQYPEPRALQGRVTTPGMYHVMAQLMAKAGGGDLDERLPPIGWLDVAPEQIEELVNHFGGGITSLGNRGLRAFEQMQAGNLDGAFEVLSAAPITSRLLVSPSEARAIADRYYSERGEFARHKAIVDNRIAQGMPLDEAIADRPPEYFTGAQQATYQRHGRRQDGTRYRRGEGRVDSEGNPIIEYTEGSPRDVLKSANRRVSALNEAVREIRAATITNAELAEMYAAHYDAHTKGLGQVGAIDGVTGRPADIGLPDDFDGDAAAPARVRNRAIKILQDMRAEEQRRLLRSIEYERKLQSVRR